MKLGTGRWMVAKMKKLFSKITLFVTLSIFVASSHPGVVQAQYDPAEPWDTPWYIPYSGDGTCGPSGSVNQSGGMGTGSLTTVNGANGRIDITGTPLTWDEMAQVVYNAGFRGQDLINFIAISNRESGRGATRYVYNPSTKDNSYGPWMMNIWVGTDTGGLDEMLGYVKAGGGTKIEDMYDPQIAANAAYHMFKRYGDKPWLGYREGIGISDMPAEWITAATEAASKIDSTVDVGTSTSQQALCSLNGNSNVSGEGINKTIGGVRYYSQCDPAWGSYGYGVNGDNVCTSGCGPTSVAMAISTIKKDPSITPQTLAQFGSDNGTIIITNGESAGSYLSIATKGASNWGLKWRNVTRNRDEVANIFQSGGYVIANVGPGDFTSGGHYIVLRSFDSSGNLLVSDPNDKQPSNPEYLKKSLTAWDFDKVMTQTKSMIGIYP